MASEGRVIKLTAELLAKGGKVFVSTFQAAGKASDDLAKSNGVATKNQESFAAAADKSRKASTKSATSLKKLAKGYVGVAASIAAATYAVGKFAQQGGRMVTMQNAFNKNTIQGVDVMNSMKATTRGLISEFALLEQKNRAIALGAVQTTAQFNKMAEGALILGRAMNVDAAFALNSLTLGIGRQSRLFLDNLGIIIKVEEAYRRYGLEMGRAASELTEVERRAAFTMETMRKIGEETERLGGMTLNAGDAFTQLTVELTDSKNAMASWLAQSLRMKAGFDLLSAGVNAFRTGNSFETQDFLAEIGLKKEESDIPKLNALIATLEEALSTIPKEVREHPELASEMKGGGIRSTVRGGLDAWGKALVDGAAAFADWALAIKNMGGDIKLLTDVQAAEFSNRFPDDETSINADGSVTRPGTMASPDYLGFVQEMMRRQGIDPREEQPWLGYDLLDETKDRWASDSGEFSTPVDKRSDRFLDNEGGETGLVQKVTGGLNRLVDPDWEKDLGIGDLRFDTKQIEAMKEAGIDDRDELFAAIDAAVEILGGLSLDLGNTSLDGMDIQEALNLMSALQAQVEVLSAEVEGIPILEVNVDNASMEQLFKLQNRLAGQIEVDRASQNLGQTEAGRQEVEGKIATAQRELETVNEALMSRRNEWPEIMEYWADSTATKTDEMAKSIDDYADGIMKRFEVIPDEFQRIIDHMDAELEVTKFTEPFNDFMRDLEASLAELNRPGKMNVTAFRDLQSGLKSEIDMLEAVIAVYEEKTRALVEAQARAAATTIDEDGNEVFDPEVMEAMIGILDKATTGLGAALKKDLQAAKDKYDEMVDTPLTFFEKLKKVFGATGDFFSVDNLKSMAEGAAIDLVSSLAESAASLIVSSVLKVGKGLLDSLLTDEDAELRKALDSNRQAIARNTASIDAWVSSQKGSDLAEMIAGLSGIVKSGNGSMGSVLLHLSAAGTTFEEISDAAASLGIELNNANGSVKTFEQLLFALGGTLSGLSGRLKMVQHKIAAYDIDDPAVEFEMVRKAIEDSLPNPLSADKFRGDSVLTPVTMENVAEVLQQWIADMESGLSIDQMDSLGELSPEDYLSALLQLEDLADAAGDAANALNDIGEALRNVPQGFKIALRRFQADQGEYRDTKGPVEFKDGFIVENPFGEGSTNGGGPDPKTGGGNSGSGGGGNDSSDKNIIANHGGGVSDITIENLTVVSDDPVDMWEKISTEARVQSRRGGVTNIQLATNRGSPVTPVTSTGANTGGGLS